MPTMEFRGALLRPSLERKIFVGFGLAFALTVAMGFFQYRTILRLVDDLRWVGHTEEVLDEIYTARILVSQAESGAFGYAISGDPARLGRYEGAVSLTAGHLQNVRRLTADDPAQRIRLDELEPLIQIRYESLRRGIELRRVSGLSGLESYLQPGGGRETMAQVDELTHEMAEEERKLLDERQIVAERSERQTRRLISLGSFLAFGLLAGSGFIVHHDMQKRQRAERALGRRTEELARSNAELEQFAYVASHDLQEPLRMVSNYTQLLGRRYQGKLDADADEFIGFAVDGASRMQALINDLLDYSRVDRKGSPLEPTSCEEVLRRALANLQASIAESQAEVTHGPLPVVRADQSQLTQLFQNLIANGLKFRAARPPRVQISAAQEDGHWTFSVSDNGIGMDSQYAERIFVVFQRLHTRQDYPGTGIGLAICKKIVERHGGRIWVESQPGQGSKFLFTLPV